MATSGVFRLACFALLCCTASAQLQPLAANQRVCNGPFDSVDCRCPDTMFSCACRGSGNCIWGSGCIPLAWRSDGYNQCGDWSDETSKISPGDSYCDCANTTAGCDLHYYNFYTPSQRCDGRRDCSDWSDEKNCSAPCPSGEFECACYGTVNNVCDAKCVSISSVNNGRNDCGDWSDEPSRTCPANYFRCHCYGQFGCTGCVSDTNVCDGSDDCYDWSDEHNCTCKAYQFECACNRTNTCPGQSCIWSNFRCNGISDCGDWSDERNCSCKANQFTCNCYKSPSGCGKNKGCIPIKKVCDGTPNCPEGEDELNCTCGGFECGCYAYKCPLTGCLNHSKVCNGVNDCGDWTDELNCTKSSSLGPWSGQSCNGTWAWCGDAVKISDCAVRTPAIVCGNMTQLHPIYQYRCPQNRTICVAEHRYITGRSKQCNGLFQCQDGTFINNQYFCDDDSAVGASCNDGSDEQCSRFGFRCSGPTRKATCTLPQANLYDDEPNCADRSDLCFVNGGFRCFQCLDRRLIISPSQVCDGVADCYDLSDECFCKNKTVCDEILGTCPAGQMRCNDSCAYMNETLCNPNVKCRAGINTKYCRCSQASAKFMQCKTWNGYKTVRKCDGIPECLLYEDECTGCTSPPEFCQTQCLQNIRSVMQRQNVNTNVRFCDGVVEKVYGTAIRRQCALVGEQYCNASRFYCMQNAVNVNIARTKVCNGVKDCDNGSDEAESLCKGLRFVCADRVQNISSGLICDGVFDCPDESDESNALCHLSRFICASGNVYSIDIKLVENGVTNCQDGSDECVTAFSNRYEMIASPGFRAFFWIMGIAAIIGNAAVFVTSAKSLCRAGTMVALTKCTNMFILNLSCADFLMGVYLITVVSVGVTYKGSYCIHDKAWRTSSGCSSLGALAIISCEASAFVMTAMTTFRLATIRNPLLVRQIEFKKVAVLTTSLAWGFATLLAVLPLLKDKLQYFQTSIWFPNYFFGTQDVALDEMIRLAAEISNTSISTWSGARRVISDAFPDFVKGEFGYYGETSVCMPRLFATTHQRGWEYSTAIITINFLMFCYIFAAYWFIYKASNRMKQSRSADKSTKLQKRIFRLIATDFCCWIPVCVMGYLSVIGVQMPTNAYVASACILLPINSALNPILYSKAIGRKLTQSKRYWSRKTLTTSAENATKGRVSSKVDSAVLVEESPT